MLLISSEERKKLDSLSLGAKRKSGQWESKRKKKSGRPEKKNEVNFSDNSEKNEFLEDRIMRKIGS